MVPGMIMQWFGSVETIPSGWHFCDGTMGTPDLRSTFIMAANVDAHPVHSHGKTGGAAGHSHPFTSDGHAHDMAEGNNIIDSTPAGDMAHQTTVSPATGDTDYVTNFPTFHALVWIMKL